MSLLADRLNASRQDIKSFLLAVHELSAEDDPIRQDFREFSGGSPDDPARATALLYPGAADTSRFDPLHYVHLAADHLQEHAQDGKFSFTGPMPSYYVDGKEVSRRFDCSIGFVAAPDPLPQPVEAQPDEPAVGCC